MLHGASLAAGGRMVSLDDPEDLNNTDDYYDDCATLLTSETGSTVETCSTHTALAPDTDAVDGAAHSPQPSPIPANLAGVPPRPLTSSPSSMVVLLVAGEMSHCPTAVAGERTTSAAFPLICASWGLLLAGEVPTGALQPLPERLRDECHHRRLLPLLGETRWSTAADAAASLPPSKLVCVYQVGRKDVPAEFRSLCPMPTHRSLSRVHCEVRLYFSLLQTPLHIDEQGVSPPRAAYKWTSFDLVDCTSSNGTFFRGVRLFPSHRYSFQVNDASGDISCIELQLGDVYRLNILVGDESSCLHTVENAAFVGKAGTVARLDAAVQWVAPPTVQPQRKGASPSRPAGGARAKRKKSVTVTSDASAATRIRHTSPQKTRVTHKKSVVPPISFSTNETAAPPAGLTIVTTGIQLTRVQRQKLRRMNVVVNPAISQFNHATYLVIHGPLMRSVKLMTALPYVQHIVDRAWLDATLAASSSSLLCAADPEHFRYTERRTRGSIETVNDFLLEDLMQTPLQQRQSLFAGQVFWVHPDAKPQDPPDNDLRYVIVASGGVLTEVVSDATVVVMPRVNVTASMLRHVLLCPKEPQCIYVVPDDIFRGVLQQRQLTTSTVRRPKRGCTLSPNLPESESRRKCQAPVHIKLATTR